ncbi:hypothetical protein, partial [Streptomyces sp. N35]|uniref:hypothetical protein n=1 Tax=Streptomyces sp. N35 TaxID=2795730 RepID=UPI001F15F1D7
EHAPTEPSSVGTGPYSETPERFGGAVDKAMELIEDQAVNAALEERTARRNDYADTHTQS